MKNIIYCLTIIVALFAFSSVSKAQSVPIDINYAWTFQNTATSAAYDEWLLSTSPITSSTTTNGYYGYLISASGVLTNNFSTIFPANTPNGTYYLAGRSDVLIGTNIAVSAWSTNLVINYINLPTAPVGLQVIAH
jgi:hypothetical protein